MCHLRPVSDPVFQKYFSNGQRKRTEKAMKIYENQG
jgi:hypothetical protein